ncbi:hypothetical protein ACKGJO_09285 [Gracilimonas sp. Q87]|uniref:hypothetical protein n=1 Tax=Gracilimonas sp. Q87 TaxID=3384766 RepID=UPI0039842094
MLTNSRKQIFDYFMMQGMARSEIRNYNLNRYKSDLLKSVNQLLDEESVLEYFNELGKILSENQFLFKLRYFKPSEDPLYHNQVFINYNPENELNHYEENDYNGIYEALINFSKSIKYESNPYKLTTHIERRKLFDSFEGIENQLFDLFYIIQTPQSKFIDDLEHSFKEEQSVIYDDLPHLSKKNKSEPYMSLADLITDYIKTALFISDLRYRVYTYDYESIIEILGSNINFIKEYIKIPNTGFYETFIEQLTKFKAFCNTKNIDDSDCFEIYQLYDIDTSVNRHPLTFYSTGQLEIAKKFELIDQDKYDKRKKKLQKKYNTKTEYDKSYLYNLIVLTDENKSVNANNDVINYLFYDGEISDNFDFSSSNKLILSHYKSIVNDAINNEISFEELISHTKKIWNLGNVDLWRINDAFLFAVDYLRPQETVKWLYKSDYYHSGYDPNYHTMYSLYKSGYEVKTTADFHISYFDDQLINESYEQFSNYLKNNRKYIIEFGKEVDALNDPNYLYNNREKFIDENRRYSILRYNIDPNEMETNWFSAAISNKEKLLSDYESYFQGDLALFNSEIIEDQNKLKARQKDYPKVYHYLNIVGDIMDARLYELADELHNDYYEFAGFDKVRWKSEYSLFLNLQKTFKNKFIQFQASPQWLGKQSFDIYFPIEKIAVEYNGLQHYEPVEIFGGESGLHKTKARDRRKKELANENECLLIEHKYDDSFSKTVSKIEKVL